MRSFEVKIKGTVEGDVDVREVTDTLHVFRRGSPIYGDLRRRCLLG